jgi:pantetheine-phosphate adenylyltransferase
MPVKIFIQGEEDLLFLPACFFAPSGSAIVYGLKDKGGIIVSVEKETKKKMRGYLSNIQKWDEVIAGGTFDRFHAGHKYFLLTALENGKKSLIGITSEEYLEEWKKNNGDVSSIQKRVKKLKEFLSKFDFNYELFKINDPFGPSLKRGEAIIVSKETQKRVKEINKERKKKEIKELKIIKVRTVMAENGKEISSSQIRNGEIDENGRITSKL